MLEKVKGALAVAGERLQGVSTSTKISAVVMSAPVLALPVFADGEEAASTSTALSSIVTSQMISGVLDEVIGLLPTILPVMIGFIALRKGISFVLNMLHSA